MRAALAFVAAGCAAVPAAAAESDFSDKETRAMTADYAACVVKRQPKRASEAILANAGNAELLRRYPQLIIDDCLTRIVKTTVKMRFQGDLYRYALADALVQHELASVPLPDVSKVPLLSQVDMPSPPLLTDMKGKPLRPREQQEVQEQYQQALAFAYLARFGECVARNNPAGAKTLILTRPDTPEERAGFAALRLALATCVPPGKTLSLGRVALRGTIAVNYYRLAHAGKNAAVSAGRGTLH